IVLFMVTGCFFDSGTWDNDEDNWERIFYTEKPDDIVINNSRFWKSSHWTYEYYFFIEIQKNKAFASKIIKENNLRKAAVKEDPDFFGDKPDWFLPQDIDKYELWQEQDKYENMKLYIDKEKGTIFLTDYQL